MRRGSVTTFDEVAGLGTIADDEGVEFRFHVIEIADGSRTIEVGRAVVFNGLARFGEIQAASILKL